jgi:hypothetical protein
LPGERVGGRERARRRVQHGHGRVQSIANICSLDGRPNIAICSIS